MRTLGIVAAVAVVLLVGLPPVFGFIAAAQLEDGVAELEVLGLDAEIVGYERGWFGSRARLALDTRSGSPEAASLGVAADLLGERPVVIVDLAHGPVAVLDGVSVGTSRFVARLDPATAGVGAAEERLGVPYLFEFRGHTNFLGTLAYDADIPAVDTTLGPSDRLAFSGVEIDGTYARGRLVAAAATQSLALVTAGGTLSFDALELDVDHDLYEHAGGSSLSLGRGTIVDAFGTQTLFAASGLQLEGAIAAGSQPELRDVRFGLKADSVDVADWDVSAAELALDLRNLDTTVIEQYTALARSGNSASFDPAPFVRRLLAAGPELELDPLRFDVDDEPLDAAMLVTVNPDALPPTAALDPLAASLWLAAIDARATLEVAKPLAARIGAFVMMQRSATSDDAITDEQRRYFAEAQVGLALAALTGQGILVESGNTYRVEVGAHGGSLTVNGQPLL